MILEDITISDFGLFRGIQKLEFGPITPERPIILVGGLNGSGKTTLMDALQLVLFGRRANLSNRGALSYEEYLRRSSNNVGESNETSITLRFRRWTDGREQVFSIKRSWKTTGRTVGEKIVVMRDGLVDKYLTDTWADFVEEIIPVEIAQLFLFDGEKIESFADPETSKQLLAKAINTLLGLDVVSRLQADLLALERRKQMALKTDKERQKIIEVEALIDSLRVNRADLIQKRAAKQNEVDRREKQFRESQENYSRNGGLLFDQRENFENERHDVVGRLRESDAQLREMAEAAAPLLLVQDLLLGIRQQHERELQAEQSALVTQTLSTRDSELMKLMVSLQMPPEELKTVNAFLEEDRTKRATSANTEVYLHLSPEAFHDLQSLQSPILPQTKKSIIDLLIGNVDLQTELVDVERKLAGVPAQDFVAELIAHRDLMGHALSVAKSDLTEIDADLKRIVDQCNIAETRLTVLLENAVSERFEAEDTLRILEHSKGIRETMKRFRESVTQRHTGRIAALVLDSFRHLLRKESLISDLTIDAESFSVEIRDFAGKSLSPDRLSAGERQLLAVSLLWGLARASGYPLPVAIDTPLGRLDSVHRNNLVENYFPQASHQVILLSTNKEIDEELFLKIEPFIGRAYRLEYDDRSKATEIKEGYFGDLWQSNTLDFLSKGKTNSLGSNA